MILDPQVSAFYGDRLRNAPPHPPTVEKARADADAAFNDKGSRRLPVFRTEDRMIPSAEAAPYFRDENSYEIPVRIYTPFEPTGNRAGRRPPDESSHIPPDGGDDGDAVRMPIMLYFHGGGFVMHNISSHDSLCRKLALACRCLVVSVGYRLAPEFQFPACLLDGYGAAVWAHRHAKELGADPNKLILAGDSAGATISAALSLFLRDRFQNTDPALSADIPRVKLQILCYGAFGSLSDEESQSVRLYGSGGYVLPKTMMNWCMKQYIPQNADPGNPFLYPGRSKKLSGLPPTLSVTAECDPLRDDGEAFSQLLEESGNAVAQYRAPGMMHGFLLHWERFDRAREVIRRVAEAVSDAFGVR